MKIKELISKPIKLSETNYTTLSQTPWAGCIIKEKFKSHLNPKDNIGESWELSWDLQKPSFIESTKLNLYEIAPELAHNLNLSKNENFDLLIKILSSSENLSIQMHPNYQDKNLASNECGKYESWLILDAKPESGIYLGFKDTVTIEQIDKTLEQRENLDSLLNFIPVREGDYFEIPPETIHAIGKGVTALEPQRLLFGKRGKTFRLWDWNRKYTEDGKLDLKNGKPRTLHVKECLERLTIEKQNTKSILALKKNLSTIATWSFGVWKRFAENPYYKVNLVDLKDSARLEVKLDRGYSSLIVLSGNGDLECQGKRTPMKPGDSYLLTHKTYPSFIHSTIHFKIAFIHPTLTNLQLFES